MRVHLFGKPCLLGFWFCFTKFLSCFMLEFGECEIRKGGIVPEKGHGLMVKRGNRKLVNWLSFPFTCSKSKIETLEQDVKYV